MSLRAGALLAALFVFGSTSAVVAAPTYDWSGFYVGFHGGGDWNNSTFGTVTDQVNQVSGVFVPGRGIVIVPGTTVSFPAARTNTAQGFAGGQLGWSATFGALVLGAEGDIRTGGGEITLTSNTTLPSTALTPAGTVTDIRTISTDWAWSGRGRVGFAWDRFQIYATGGLAGINFNASGRGIGFLPGGRAAPCGTPETVGCHPGGDITLVSRPDTTITGGQTDSGDRTGWTAGGGAEMMIEDDLSVGVEYRHSDYGDIALNIPSNTIDPGFFATVAPAGSSSVPGGDFVILGAQRVELIEDAVSLRFNIHL